MRPDKLATKPGRRCGRRRSGQCRILMEWAVGKHYDIYRPNTRQAAAAGLEDPVGNAHPRGRRRDSRSRGTGGLSLSERRGAEVSRRALSYLGRSADRQRVWTFRRTRSSNASLSRAEAAGAPREFPAAHASARQGDVDGSHPAGRHDQLLSYVEQLQLQLDEQLHLRGRFGAGAAEGHGHPDHRLARQHGARTE